MTREIDPRDLSRGQQKKLQGRGSESERWVETPPFGDLAEELVAEEYGLTTSNSGRYWDAVTPDDDDRTEVKSTSSRIGDDYPEQGRFRLWKSQVEELVDHEQQTDNDAWIAFVLFHEPDGIIYMDRLTPSAVESLVQDEYGGWDESGHEEMGEQQKLPWDVVIDV